jgi:hypothetical protein
MTKFSEIESTLAKEISDLISEYETMRGELQNGADFKDETYYFFLTRFEEKIVKTVGQKSVYAANLLSAKNKQYSSYGPIPRKAFRLDAMIGILSALKVSIINGELRPISELLNAALFSDFLEMAEHLLEEGYEDAAAVIIGSVLEEHIRKLCIKNDVSLTYTDAKSKIKPESFENLNVNLRKAGVYKLSDQQLLTGWYTVRNAAAHGNYSEYDEKQVKDMFKWVRDFITRHPA